MAGKRSETPNTPADGTRQITTFVKEGNHKPPKPAEVVIAKTPSQGQRTETRRKPRDENINNPP